MEYCINGCQKPIQNKKYRLCGECIFKKTHGGKSKQEVYAERAKKKQPEKFLKWQGNLKSKFAVPIVKVTSTKIKGKELHVKGRYIIGEEELKNIANQDRAEQEAKDAIKRKKTPIRKVSIKEQQIARDYKKTIVEMDYLEEKVCSGCNQYQGGDIKLSHSHIISRDDCKKTGLIELISDRRNLVYHCMDFGEHTGCHRKWENPKERKFLLDYDKNMEFIKSVSIELYNKYSK